MSIETPDELERLKAVGQIVAEAIRAMRAHVRPGVTTRELDEIGGRVFARAGARSGPQLDYGFPGVNCISVNDEAVHGIPSKRRLRKGDLLKLDVTAELDGFYADACISVPVGDTTPSARRLAAASRAALNRALATARAGVPINHVGRVIESTVTAPLIKQDRPKQPVIKIVPRPRLTAAAWTAVNIDRGEPGIRTHLLPIDPLPIANLDVTAIKRFGMPHRLGHTPRIAKPSARVHPPTTAGVHNRRGELRLCSGQRPAESRTLDLIAAAAT